MEWNGPLEYGIVTTSINIALSAIMQNESTNVVKLDFKLLNSNMKVSIGTECVHNYD